MKKSVILFAAFLLVPAATATTIESEQVRIDLATSEVEVQLEIEDLTASRLTYFTDHSVSGAEIEVNNSTRNCEVFSSSSGAQISCDTELRNNFTAKINYRASGLVNQERDTSIFQMEKNHIRPTRNFDLTVMLPRGGIISDSNGSEPSISPTDARRETDGRRIQVHWVGEPNLDDSTTYKIVYRTIDSRNNLLRIAGITGLLIAGLSALYLIMRRLNQEELKKLYDSLDEDEIKVLELLQHNQGDMLQKDIVEELEYSKAKVSETVSELVEKDILLKEKDGRSNRIKIQKKYRY